jgi:shikimate kinase / 3-dehydroquinate synthase
MIFLTGFMGSGKTSVGRALSRNLGLPFLDLDELISARAGSSIAEIFSCAGEEAFRALERKALAETASAGRPCVVATGGGLPAHPLNRRLMKASGVVVNLHASFETLRSRIPGDGSRPLWKDDALALYQARAGAYADADLVVMTDNRPVEEIAMEIASSLDALLPDPVGVILEDNPYPVYIGKGIFPRVLSLMRRFTSPEGIFVLADEEVLRHHGHAVEQALAPFPHAVIPVPSGEDSKSMAFLEKVLTRMFTLKVNRQWVCLALGGGVTGDLAGFAASIYMRGIPVVQAATTLLAQVDSGIGGKTAVNTDFGKNLAGTFYQPLFVLSDTGFLNTLEPAQLRSAMAEVIKYGIIMDRQLFAYIENGPPYDYQKIVTMCSRDKALVVSRDEREGGLRRILNFGHTLGHAVEKSTGYAVLHGEAVGVGMLFASWLSLKRGMLPEAHFTRIRKLIDREGIIPPGLKLPPLEDVKQAMSLDKKGSEKGFHFVLTPSIGDVSVQKLSEIEVLEAYRGFADEYARGL